MVYEYGNQSDAMVPPQYFFVSISQYHAQYLFGAKTLEYRTLEIIKYAVLKALNVCMLVDARSNSS